MAQLISSVFTIVAVFVCMLYHSIPLTAVAVIVVALSLKLAGAARIFAFMEEEPEADMGYVTLVNAQAAEDGAVTEFPERTGHWAWKHPHHDGTLTYTELKGAITMENVDFGYTPEKTVLHDITLYANPGQKIAFVGATGAGKTTITNLINRFYDIADGFIRMLPEGYRTLLQGDGSGLSQGQRQLISIARAAVSDPPVMILDEATSSIDTRTEALV